MNRLKEVKKIYDETPIPDELHMQIQQMIKNNVQSTRPRYRSSWFAIPLGIATAFIFLLNTSGAFAATVSDIPLVGYIAKIFTITSYQKEDASKYVDVKIPALKETGNSELEKQINTEIKEKINETVSQSEKNAEQYYHAFLETGGDESDFLPVIINVDYEIKSSNDDFVSFVITKLENHTSVETEKYFYNINLKTGEMITLQDLYGPQYKEVINPQITQQIKEREESNENQMFFHDHGLTFKTIADDQKFYINDSNQFVIVFDKYEIAPGAMGFPEFILSSLPNLTCIQ